MKIIIILITMIIPTEEVIERVEVPRSDPLSQRPAPVVAIGVETAIGQATDAAKRVEELKPIVRVTSEQQEMFRHHVRDQLGVTDLGHTNRVRPG